MTATTTTPSAANPPRADAIATWNELVARHYAIEAIDVGAMPHDEQDPLFDEAGDVIGKIMAMPAPNAAAARWKLDYIVGTPRGSECYEAGYLTQLVADYRRFLTDTPATGKSASDALAVVDRLATDTQSLARQIQALARPARYGITEEAPRYGEPFTEAFADTLTDADFYLGLIQETASTIASHAREIERNGLDLRVPARAQVRS